MRYSHTIDRAGAVDAGALFPRVHDAARTALAATGLSLHVTTQDNALAAARGAIDDGYVFPCLDPDHVPVIQAGEILAAVVRDGTGAAVAAVGGRRFADTSVRGLLGSGRLWGGEALDVALASHDPTLDRRHRSLALLGGLAVAPRYRGARIGAALTQVIRTGVLAVWSPTVLFALHKVDKSERGMIRGYFQYPHDTRCAYAAHGTAGRPRHREEVIGWVLPEEAMAIAMGWLGAVTRAYDRHAASGTARPAQVAFTNSM